MTPRFLFHPAARAELIEAHAWYESQRAGLGDELVAIVAATIDRIRNHPELYPVVEQDVRRAVLTRFPYGLFYRAEPDAIRVLAVFHHKRNPVVWRGRAAV